MRPPDAREIHLSVYTRHWQLVALVALSLIAFAVTPATTVRAKALALNCPRSAQVGSPVVCTLTATTDDPLASSLTIRSTAANDVELVEGPYPEGEYLHDSDPSPSIIFIEGADLDGLDADTVAETVVIAFRYNCLATGSDTITVASVGASGNLAVRVTCVPSGGLTRETRDIVFIQGIDSNSRCTDQNGDGLPDEFAEHVNWMRTYLQSEPWVKQRVDIANFLYFSYAGIYDCSFGSPLGAYIPKQTCGGVTKASEDLKYFIETYATSKVTIIGHSMGGLVAAHLVASEPTWSREHVASVITFDSPLHGLSAWWVLGLDAESTCDLNRNPPDSSLLDLYTGSSVVTKALTAATATVVKFYTIDAIRRDFVINIFGFRGPRTVEFVPAASTSLPGQRMHIPVDDDHTSVWQTPSLTKKVFVACGVIAANTRSDCGR